MKNLIKTLLAVMLVTTTLATNAQRRHDTEFVADIPAGRNIVMQPQLGKDRPYHGKIAVDFTIDRKGNVIAAHADRRTTTIRNRDYITRIEIAVSEAKFSKMKRGPETQHGRLTYNF